MALNPRQKKLKSFSIYSLLLGLLFLPNWLVADELSSPPAPGEKTQTSVMEQEPPPELPKSAPESDDSRNIPKKADITIIHKQDATIEEYRVNGRLRYVKIIPKTGKPYYLVDKDGDGQLETRHSDLDGVPPINEWILMEW